MKVLFVCSEAVGLVKTGGLGDVAAALPAALRTLGVDARIVMPAYRGIAEKAQASEVIGQMTIRGRRFDVRKGRLPDSDVPVLLIDHPDLFVRGGNPYHDDAFVPWKDNALRFGFFNLAVAQLAAHPGDGWRPDVVHCNDWQSGLVPALLAPLADRPRCVFTIHNLAYQGLFERSEFDALGLPPSWWTPDGIEFYGQFSFMKAGVMFCDAVTTVSPTYAQEIQTAQYGCGLEGCLRARAAHLSGIINGIDGGVWNPESDRYLAKTYTARTLEEGKRVNKRAVQQQLGLIQDPGVPMIGIVGRLADQKGTDLVLAALPSLLAAPVQFAVLASGDPGQEQSWRNWTTRAAGRVGARITYDEGLAHRIEAGADMFLMPSRYEPCGLNQMYSQVYGTVPLVRRTGGLGDTVEDATPETLNNGSATGIVFNDADTGGVVYAVERALQLMAIPSTWSALQQAGMARDFSWERSAAEYRVLYQSTLASSH
jgi:starch synthase